MPSAAWNVFVASGVAVVVYLGVRMGRVLPALVAGTMLFIGGWMTGYAINQGAPIGIPRMLIAGGICGFVIVWTLLIKQGDYVIGGVVIVLVSFAAWFTSEMGPIKGEGGPTSPIDEPKPPEGPRPGTPLDPGGENDTSSASDASSRTGVLGGLRDLFSPAATDAPEPPESGSPEAEGPPAGDLRHHSPTEEDEGPTYSTRRADPDDRGSGERESIFGLGIFYEGDPEGPTPAGATESTSTATEPKDGDHTRPGATDTLPSENEEPVRVEVDPEEDDETASSAVGDDGSGPASEAGPVEEPEPAESSPIRRLREPLNSPRRPGKSPEVESVNGRSSESSNGTTDTAAEPTDEGSTNEDPEGQSTAGDIDDEPPEEHRVEIEDDGGFVFG